MEMFLRFTACLLAFGFSAELAHSQSYPMARTGGNYMHNYYLPPPSPDSPRWPGWSPDGEWLAFAMHGSIWRIKLGSTEAEELTHSQNYDSSPSWSPDGDWIAYTSEDDGRTLDLMILNVSTGISTIFRSGDHLYLDPVWSPDGWTLAYVSTEPAGFFNIYTQQIERGLPVGEPVALTRDNLFGRSRLYFSDNDLHIQPTWSPGGDEIIFLSNRGIALGSGAIWRMPVERDGMESAQLVHSEQTLYRTRPNWSPDGSRIVYSSHVGGQYNQLYLLPAKGGQPYKITFGEWDHFQPSWSPDGSKIAYLSNEAGPPQIHILETVGGQDTEVVIEQKKWKIPVGRIAVTVIDSETGRHTESRVYAQSVGGKAYAPDGTYHRVGRLNEHFFHANGSFSMDVPTGSFSVESVKGFEYLPAKQTVEIEAGKVTALALTMRRIVDMPAEGWYSGSTHVHMNYAGDLHNTLENLMFMSAAEDQAVVNELVANKDNRILDYQYFTGKVDPLTTAERVLMVGEEYRPAFHGHIFLLGLTDHLLSPFASGYAGTAIESLYPSNTDVFRLAEKQGAFRGYVHPYFGDRDPNGGDEPTLGTAKAFPVDAALGTVEALEMSYASRAAYIVWHHMLNNDIKIIPVGGEDSISSLYRTAIVGQVRTYAYLGESPLTWDNWLSAVRKGHTMVTNGPLPFLSINGRMPGEEIRLPAEGGTVTLTAEVRSIVPLDRAVIYRNGEITLSVPLKDGVTDGVFAQQIDVRESGWYTLHVESDQAAHPIDDGYPQASTNAIRIYVGDQPIRSPESARYFVRWIDRLMEMAEAHPGWRSDEEMDSVMIQFMQARRVYEVLAR